MNKKYFKKWVKNTLFATTCGSVATTAAAQSTNVEAGKTAGEFQVNNMGVATYTVPLVGAPGRQGVEPNLSLQYNSQSGNGPLGLRWILQSLRSSST
ncbi:SpvB/TcaC N-terminal domain-containing protein [Marinibactrum halimedae]|uniref:Uncharacterized protein n=1 Tax=Marinibactrum halimedae TaxID=1444977 RepID=A0AA37T2C8_9GAMM|nr:SpvB/TcaC N-terminal domain-containing protein [Marinibactrum halimedae]MCD9458183.1 hypothetical protein [Marinibactrum halimedae]GLS25118.1 hypothetical protein GCM10007877_08320 [Marinibactrum halimedae]